MQILDSYARQIGDNQQLPDTLRQSCVLLTFGQPVRSANTGEFLRIHLTPGMMQDGEESFYLAEQFQPHRCQVRLCTGCGGRLDRIAEQYAVCRAPACRLRGKRVAFGPVRGVVDVLVFPDFVVDRTVEQFPVPDPAAQPPTLADFLHRRVSRSSLRRTPTILQDRMVEWVDRCLLVLDRRYNDRTLASVYRTAGEICDMRGWSLA